MNSIRVYFALLRWDCIREFKKAETLVSMLLFAAVTLFISALAIDPNTDPGLAARPGLLWVSVLLAGSIAIERAFRGADQEVVLQGLMLAPIPKTVVYYAKLSSTLLLVCTMESMVVIAFSWLYNLTPDFFMFVKLCGIMWFGSIGFVACGLTLSAFTRCLEGGEVLLRILLFPLLVPLMNGGVEATECILLGKDVPMDSYVLLACFSVTYVAVGQLLFGSIVKDFDA